MKKILFFCLISFLLIACDDKNSNSSDNENSGTENGKSDAEFLDSLLSKGALTTEETELIKSSCLKDNEDDPEDYEECEDNSLLTGKVLKAIDCMDRYEVLLKCDSEQCEDDASEKLEVCFTTGIKPYIKEIENTAMYKSMIAYDTRDNGCCKVWEGDTADYCDEEEDDGDSIVETYLNTLMNIHNKCASEFVKAYQCAGKLSCDQPSDPEDNSVYALCYYKDSSVYIGDNYSNTEACMEAQTYHCQAESDALNKCLGYTQSSDKAEQIN